MLEYVQTNASALVGFSGLENRSRSINHQPPLVESLAPAVTGTVWWSHCRNVILDEN
jgi:hypothetical protein